jgi:hypothetical protein
MRMMMKMIKICQKGAGTVAETGRGTGARLEQDGKRNGARQKEEKEQELNIIIKNNENCQKGAVIFQLLPKRLLIEFVNNHAQENENKKN